MTSNTHASTVVETADASSGPTAERRRARVAAIALIASPILWFVGAIAFFTTLGTFYSADDPVAKLNGIAGQRVAWTVQTLLFFAGALSASVGLILVARLVRSDAPALALIGALAAAAAVMVDVAYTVVRLAAPLDGVRAASDVPPLLLDMHAYGTNAPWLGVVPILVTVGSVGLLALALSLSGKARWTGAILGLLCGALLAVILTGGSPPPVAVYPIAAVLGLRLLFWRAPGS